MGLFKKPGEKLDKPRPDFSNVSSGGSSTGNARFGFTSTKGVVDEAEKFWVVVRLVGVGQIALAPLVR